MISRILEVYQRLPTAVAYAVRGVFSSELPNFRSTLELRELLHLNRRAALSIVAQRAKAERRCDYRPEYARDVDRIIYSLCFMPLAGKTQVFSPEAFSAFEGQRIHNRLFHTIKVFQIARDICRNLGLNEDLAMAIALAHDLGHPPFGHEGEKVLSKLSLKYLGKEFRHNRQSLRIVKEIERQNLTLEVENGIVTHCGEELLYELRPCRRLVLDDSELPATLEGCVVRIADIIAYLPMDLQDALSLGIVAENQIPPVVRTTLGQNARNIDKMIGKIIDTLVRDVIVSSSKRLNAGERCITTSHKTREALKALFDFNYKYIYFGELKNSMVSEIEECMETLYQYFTTDQKMTPQKAIDAVAGLTDRQAKEIYQSLTGRELFKRVIKPGIKV